MGSLTPLTKRLYMTQFTSMQQRKALAFLVFFHLLIITSSNYLVQIPFTLFGFHTTWGAFTFPFIFLATDLTVRIYGASMARNIILKVMLPALVISYALSVLFYEGAFQGVAQLAEFNLHSLAQLGIERRERLVEQEQPWRDGQGAGDGDALALAA